MNKDVMFSSVSSEWETPPELFEALDEIFCFTIDLAASDENHLCERYYKFEDKALEKSWQEEVAWLNPPYGREIKAWMEKCREAAWIGKLDDPFCGTNMRMKRTVIVALIPGRNDTKWMQENVYGESEEWGADYILDIKGRLKFDNPLMDWDKPSPAPFPSRLAFFGEIYDHEMKAVAALNLGQILKPIYL